ncbi:peptidase M56 [Sporosarcina sp. PTS2304]|uniref:M56 family metallopeptidase n=1 Tax=Sporosarcina sp. PTS2304 TaxID=2283194 RepID=UPI000E0E0262|nr:M56 family metallopeptidase [Sporosarcina sp. PTS2304]AXH99752.1 peptidase M56 [Sporosarcina sp. PTS2304]
MNLMLEFIVVLTVAGSTVVIFVLLLQLISPHLFSAKWRYAIGNMAMWFYVIPVAIIVRWVNQFLAINQGDDVLTLTKNMSIQGTHIVNPIEMISKQSIPTEVAWILLILWAMGALTYAIWQTYCYYKFIRKIKETTTPILKDSEVTKKLASLKQLLGINGNVKLAYSPVVKSPVLIGLLRPTILLPMDDKVDMDLGMVIHHELVHLKRKDLWIRMLVLVVSTLHWFNPFAHFLRKDINMWSELSCDEEVVKEMSYTERKTYGQTILNVMIGAKGLPVKFCASLSGDGKQLKRRLMMMLNVKKPNKKTMFMTAVLILAIGVIGTSTAVWAANNTPEVENFPNEPIASDAKGGSIIDDGNAYDYTFEALTSEQQKYVTKEMAQYYLDEQGNVVHFTDLNTGNIPFESLTAKQQQQATKEIGHYSFMKVNEMINK